MKTHNTFVTLTLFFLLTGCSLGPASVLEPRRPSPELIPEQTEAESDALAKLQRGSRKDLEKEAPRTVEVEPMMPQYDPLDDQIVSFSMVDEDLQLILYSLSQAVGMNLIIDPSLSEEKRLVTLNLENLS
ncbi:MAG: hypothetical protein AMK69_22435 [Nitrospira bacterium SG8_3]|nr:MAG: hypothetical protein AMK69_22435 [Nitrospira bacterium SG8_3]